MDSIIRLKPMTLPVQTSRANTIYVDTDTEAIKVGTGASGSSERTLLDTSGNVSGLFPDGAAATPSIASKTTPTTGYFFRTAGEMNFVVGGTEQVRLSGGVQTIDVRDSVAASSFRLGTGIGATADVILTRDAANTLAQRNGTADQTYRIYSHYVDGSNYSRAFFQAGDAANYFGSEAAGSGTLRPLTFYVGADRWQITTSGHWLAAADNAYDIGANGNAPRDVMARRQFISYSGSNVGVVAAAVSDGVWKLSNYATSGFTRLILGTNDASGVAINKSGTTVEAKLGNDSAYADFRAANVTANFLDSGVSAAITASTTQTQGQQALTSQINNVSTCANANDVVTLPAAVAGRTCIIFNNGAQTLQIYPASGDDLGAGVDASATLAAGSNRQYVAFDTTNWEIV